MTPALLTLAELRRREADLVATLKKIDGHLCSLQTAKTQREAALARIRGSILLFEGARSPDCDAD